MGAEHVTMQSVAEAAGVGKGTLFRRFGDRAGLLLALLGEAEAEFQEAYTEGPPPLGPGAPARDRLEAFGCALIERIAAGADLGAALRRQVRHERRHASDTGRFCSSLNGSPKRRSSIFREGPSAESVGPFACRS